MPRGDSYQVCFNPHSPRRGSATRTVSGLLRSFIGFNPHSPRRGSATGYSRLTQVTNQPFQSSLPPKGKCHAGAQSYVSRPGFNPHSPRRGSATARCFLRASITISRLSARTSLPSHSPTSDSLSMNGKKSAYVRARLAPREPAGVFMDATGSRDGADGPVNPIRSGHSSWLDDQWFIEIDLRRRAIDRQITLAVSIQAVDPQAILFFVDTS